MVACRPWTGKREDKPRERKQRGTSFPGKEPQDAGQLQHEGTGTTRPRARTDAGDDVGRWRWRRTLGAARRPSAGG